MASVAVSTNIPVSAYQRLENRLTKTKVTVYSFVAAAILEKMEREGI